jgi:hypothetical protein
MEKLVPQSGGLKSLLLIHKAMLTGQLILAGIAFYLIFSNTFSSEFQHLNQILQVIALLFSVAGFYVGSLLFKKKLLQARETLTGIKEKWTLYRAACMIQWALLEAPCIFVIIGFLLTGNYAFLALAGALILLFAMMAPTKLKIAFQLQISEAEMVEL